MDVHVIVDIVGFYDDGQLADGVNDGLRFAPQSPTRIVDSRNQQGMSSALGQQATATITPPTLPPATEALALNITAVSPTNTTFVTVWPNGIAQPTVSTLNPVARQTIPNAAIVTLGVGSQFNVYNNAGTVHIVIDQVGSFYFLPALNGVSSNATKGTTGVRQYQRQAIATPIKPTMHHP